MTDEFIDLDEEIEVFEDAEEEIIEETPSTKLARRRRIEELHEERLLKAELSDFDDI